MSFSIKLKELRLRNNLTQEQLARKLDITTRTVLMYEKGKNYPSVESLTKIANFFKVSISFLMNDQNEVQAQWGKRERPGAKQLIEEISDLFSGGELSEAEKDAVMEAVQEAYWTAKKKTQAQTSL